MPKSTSPWIDSVPDTPRFPRLEGDIQSDVVVIGGGITGVMTAWHLARNGLNVALLEKNRIASGDTGFTTGFLLRVPDTSISRLERLYGTDFVKKMMEGAGAAQDTVRTLVREKGIRCGFSDCSAYYCSYRKGDPVLRAEWEAIGKSDGRASFVKGKEVSALGAGASEAIKFSGEAQFNPRAFIFGLLALPEAGKIRVFEESEATDVEVGEGVLVRTALGSVRSKKVVLASGWPIQAFSELRAIFEPKITYAIAAEYPGKAPLKPNLYWDTFDPYFYYRLLDEKTVIVGGADRRPGERPAPGEKPPHEKLKAFLEEHMGKGFEVRNAWSGTLYESPDGLPFASEHPHYRGKVFVGSCCGFGGNGLVLGTFAGSVVADLVAGRENRYAGLLSFSRAKLEIPAPAPRAPKGRTRTRVFVKVALAGDIDEDAPYCASAEGQGIALFRTKEGIFATENTCTHAGGSLCDGFLEGGVVTCPMHGAKFDVRTGQVVGPPATKPVRSYRTRVSGDSVEVEIDRAGEEAPAGEVKIAGEAQPSPPPGKPAQAPPEAARPQEAPKAAPAAPKLFDGVRRDPGYVLKASALALLFWSLQFLYLFYVSIPGQLERSMILASSFSGATLISIALMIGPLAMLFPRLNFIAHRRSFGVWGFTFIITHFTAAIIYYSFGPESFLAELNPYNNPILFGALAVLIYVPMYLTSTDWAVAKLGFRKWKAIHRAVYLAYLFSTLHYITINPELLWNLSKALLVVATMAAYALELAAYLKYVSRKRTAGNMLYGGALIAFGIILLYLAFQG